MGRQLAPHLQGASELWQVVLCIGWPIPACARTAMDRYLVHPQAPPSPVCAS